MTKILFVVKSYCSVMLSTFVPGCNKIINKIIIESKSFIDRRLMKHQNKMSKEITLLY